MALMTVASLLEMLSIGMVIPVVHAFTSSDGGGIPFLSKFDVALKQMPANLVLGVFAALFVVKNITLMFLLYAINSTMAHRTADLTEKLFDSYLERPLLFHLRANSADLIQRLTAGTRISFDAMRHLLLIVLEALLTVTTIALLLLVEPVTTLSLAAAMVVVTLVFYGVTAQRLREWGRHTLNGEALLLRWLNQAFFAIRDIKLSHSYAFLTRKVADTSHDIAANHSRGSTVMQLPRLFLEVVMVVSLLVAVFVLKNSDRPNAEIVTILGLYGMAGLRLMPSLNRILSSVAELRQRTAYVDTLYNDLRDGLFDRDRPPARPLGTASRQLTHEIRLEGVGFRYPGSEQEALAEISLTVSRGESIGFVGPSGAGKSTVVDVLLGLIMPSDGRVTADGRDIRDDLESWQRRIGYVPQQVSLFDDTLRRNIAFGQVDGDIDEARVLRALELARLDDVVASWPDGLDTILGERGARMSGGQRQRVAIARALYCDPDLLVFDEATSALDNETEREITVAIEALAGSKTVLLIAHRLSTVRNCDRIVFMKEGRIKAVGAFDSLVAENPEFRHFAELGHFDLTQGA